MILWNNRLILPEHLCQGTVSGWDGGPGGGLGSRCPLSGHSEPTQ
jgi:hypothetical protein